MRVSELADLLSAADATDQAIPVLSARAPDLDVAAAYRVQRAYVRRRLADDQIAGFKAGLTSQASQRRFGVTSPAAGVLLASGRRRTAAEIKASRFHLLMIETEIGFVVGERIAEPLEDVSALRERLRGVVPAIELPDLGFADMKKLKGVDIIAANVSAAEFIVGDERSLEGLDPNQVAVTLTLDGKATGRGVGSDAMGDQWKAARWLVNTIVRHGWEIEPGAVLLTGALGKMLPGKPGTYSADFGALGTIAFEVTP